MPLQRATSLEWFRNALELPIGRKLEPLSVTICTEYLACYALNCVLQKYMLRANTQYKMEPLQIQASSDEVIP
jgi:hypothetical protein